MLELYIFNKESPAKNGLTFWDYDSSELLKNHLSFNLDRFKIKDSSQHLLTELAQELTYHYKETEGLKKYFDGLSTRSIELELVDDFHHLVIFDSLRNTLIVDSKIQNKFIPFYLFAVNFALARQTKSEADICEYMFEFFLSFEVKALQVILDHLKRDAEGARAYDAGGHLQSYLIQLISVKESELVLNNDEKFLATQLLRNRALAGALPFDLIQFEFISEKYKLDPFDGDALQEYFESFQSSFDKKFAILYYKHLSSSLKTIGLNIVAQRGSRVAHEQGPILINSGSITIAEDFEIKIKKFRSSIMQILSNLKENYSKLLGVVNKEAGPLELTVKIQLDSLLYLASLKQAPKARFEKVILDLQSSIDDLIAAYQASARIILEKNKFSTKDKYLHFYEALKSLERTLNVHLLDLEELVLVTPHLTKNAVIYVQRPSSRSGHFIPRLVMGQKLYIETDEESQHHRLEAIPYNFVVPDFDLIASGIDSFFENASISIVTDRDSGKPNIKWENAEDLAISLAPGMYQAIKASQEKGERFHYQLETTLFGPLIELFLVILESEISNIASIERYNALNNPMLKVEDIENFTKGASLSRNADMEELLANYKSEIIEASDFVFSYYLLEDLLQDHMITEAMSREDAIFEILLGLRDVQEDVARYCIKKRKDSKLITEIKSQAETMQASFKEKADAISKLLSADVSRSEVKSFIKKFIRYPESTARRTFLEKNPNLVKVIVSSNKKIKDVDYSYDFTVAPSRIDFGKHVVASVTTLMGRMLGADDPEALIKGKEYIDYVSKAQNSFFETAGEAGSVKVIENTCRAIQYSKAISFQGVFQAFNIDGALARATINSRNTKAAGLHVMEYGTMASTGYCITKEPLFIILGLALNTDSILDKLGVESEASRNNLKILFKDLMKSRTDFSSDNDWQLHVYEELAESVEVQKYLADPDFRWLPNLKAMVTLLKYISENDSDRAMAHSYSELTSKLIEFSRIINETGIIQRVHLMNDAISRSKLKHKIDKDYSKLRIALNASYKGNVSDERENANQYLMAFLLHQKQYLKNASIPEVEALIDYQVKNYALPREIRVFDPLVDPDIFMGGELKARAENCANQLMTLPFDEPLAPETIEACVISYGSDYEDWRVLTKRLRSLDEKTKLEVETKLDSLAADFRFMETFYKGFFKDPNQAFQSLDVIQLNSDHDELKVFLEDLVSLRELMRINNPDSLLVIVDNPQQAKKPFLDYDMSLEWIALGGTISSHLIASEKYESMANMISEKSNWASAVLQKLIMEANRSSDELKKNQEYLKLKEDSNEGFLKFKARADLMRDLVMQKFNDAKEMDTSITTLKRYEEWLLALARFINYENITEMNFNDWLILGGRWLLNGQAQSDIDYVVNLFEKSENLTKLGLKGFEVMNLFVKSSGRLELTRQERIVENTGSTKEADLLTSSAADSLEFRALQSKQTKYVSIRIKEMSDYENRTINSIDSKNLESLESLWDNLLQDYMSELKKNNLEASVKVFARLLIILEHYSKGLSELDLVGITRNFTRMKEADEWSLIEIFGDHRKHGGVFQRLAEKANKAQDHEKTLARVSKLGEMFVSSYLIFLTVSVDDANEIVNKLSVFFDQYLNVHEEDYPPYMFHSLCAGSAYGFSQTYYLDTNLRAKMFKLACKSGIGVYKILHHLISNKSVLKDSSQEYRDALIGDYENGIIPLNYQHETICIEERLWDCMRSLRNFVRNYHDRHPLPVIIKGSDASVEKLFRDGLEDDVELVWIAGLASPGKHSWDVNCVFRSPLLRDIPVLDPNTGSRYINISVLTPYLTNDGEIKQIYTAFRSEVLEGLNYLAPADSYEVNLEGFVHAVVMLEGDLPRPNITMSAHTHSQYISNFTRDLGIPEVWSMLSMLQMYSKTELPKILNEIGMQGLAQLEFYHKEFDNLEEIEAALNERLAQNSYEHIDFWLLKASRDSGGRGISGRVNIHNDRKEILEFIFQKTRSDDLVMQEFVPNNARAFINPDFAVKIEDSFVESGLGIERITPYEQIYFAMRSFQSMGGIKGYLFSANIGSVTVNAGQGARMFYGEPIHIMPIYIAGKIQRLLDEQGEMILKEAIPKHAEKFARSNDISVRENNIGTTNTLMLNGLFDYIPYVYILREDKSGKEKRFTVVCEDNLTGGLDYYYSYFGKKIKLASGLDHAQSLTALESMLKDSANADWKGPERVIDIDLAKIEFNSGLGQANLLQKAVEEMVPQNRDVFLEWTEDLGTIGFMSKQALRS